MRDPTTVDQVRERVAGIRRKASGDGEPWGADNAEAHVDEDKLYLAVLRVIAEGKATDPAALAREALKANEIQYDRWYS